MTTPDIIRAHRHASYHREEILASKSCGCFDCLAIFPPTEIKKWIDDFDIHEKNEGVGQTALCPRCEIDSVIGSESGYPVTEDFLRQMQKKWVLD